MLFRPFLVIALCLTANMAAAKPIKLYDGSVTVLFAGERAAVPAQAAAEFLDKGPQGLRLSVDANVDALLPLFGRRMVQAIERESTCARRLAAWDPIVGVREGTATALVQARLEQWACAGGGETRLAQESGVIRAAIAPEVIDGALSLSLQSFSIDGLSQFARLFGVERIARGELEAILAEFNDDPNLSRLPPSFGAAGYGYRSASVSRNDAGAAIVSATAHGPADLNALFQAVGPVLKLLKP